MASVLARFSAIEPPVAARQTRQAHADNRRPVTRAGLIVNPSAGKGSGRGQALADMLRGTSGVSVRVIERFDQIENDLREFAAEGVSDLFVSSGDGTIHEILTQLAEHGPFEHLPRIGLLPHGTTNMTAADLGFGITAIAAQADYLRNVKPTDLRSRPTIRCANPADGKPRHGMFVGTGAVAEGTRYCQDAFNAKGVKGQWATFGTLASAVARSLFTAPDPNDETRLDRPYDISVEANGRQVISGTQLLVMSTTLERLVMNAKPFWGGKTGSIRTSSFPYPVPSVIRWLLPVMYGGEDRIAPPGCVSFCSEELKVTSKTMYVIDGEFFDGPADEALQLETGPVFTFVCG